MICRATQPWTPAANCLPAIRPATWLMRTRACRLRRWDIQAVGDIEVDGQAEQYAHASERPCRQRSREQHCWDCEQAIRQSKVAPDLRPEVMTCAGHRKGDGWELSLLSKTRAGQAAIAGPAAATLAGFCSNRSCDPRWCRRPAINHIHETVNMYKQTVEWGLQIATAAASPARATTQQEHGWRGGRAQQSVNSNAPQARRWIASPPA